MKKISVLIMLFMSITIFIHAQKETLSGVKDLTINLIGIKQIEKNGIVKDHLIMYDSNGAIAIDSLITVFKKYNKEHGTIIWEIGCGIDSIKEIEPKSGRNNSIIFEHGVNKDPEDKKFKLKLPFNRPFHGEEIKESYNIWYYPTGDIIAVPIDPYIDLKPPKD